MDSHFETKSLIEEWAIPYYNKIVKEIKECDGRVSNIKRNPVFIEIISQIKNLTRYDQISKDSVITYSVPKNMDFEFKF